MAKSSISFRAAALLKRFKGDKVAALKELGVSDELAHQQAAKLGWHDIVHRYWSSGKSIY